MVLICFRCPFRRIAYGEQLNAADGNKRCAYTESLVAYASLYAPLLIHDVIRGGGKATVSYEA